jgi:hypothetical protein
MPEKKITGLELGLRLFTTPPSNCTTPAKTPEPDMNDFLLQEYKALKGDMLEAVKETRFLERFALGAVGVIWIWVLGYAPGTARAAFLQGMTTNVWFNWLSAVLVLYLPAILVWFLRRRAVALTDYIDYIAKYLLEMEKAFIKEKDLSGKPFGFEQHWRPSDEFKSKRDTFWFFWRWLFRVTLIIPTLLLISLIIANFCKG